MIGDISKILGRDFVLAAIVPSAVGIGVNLLLIRWDVVGRDWIHDWNVFDLGKSTMVAMAILAVALVLSTVSTHIYKTYEGYYKTGLLIVGVAMCAAGLAIAFSTATPRVGALVAGFGGAVTLIGIGQRVSLKYHRARAKRWQEELKTSHDATKEYKFSRRYPLHDRQVRETAFGNTVRAFEEYPSRIWNLDPITNWPRLTAVLPDKMTTQVADAKTTVSLFLNLSVVAGCLGIEVLILTAPSIRDKWLWAGAAWLLLGSIMYLEADRAARGWGEQVRAAFDLYRLDLLAQMSVQLPATFSNADERRIWPEVQLMTFYTEPPRPQLKFASPKREPDRE